GAVDVHGDGNGVAGVADAVYVAGWREAAYGPGRGDVAGGEPAHATAVGQREDLLVLAPLEDACDAPGHVIMDHRLLPGHPDHGRYREAAVGFGVQQVALIARWVTAPQRDGEDGRRVGQVGAQGGGDTVRGVLPAEAAADLGADRADEAVRARPGDHGRDRGWVGLEAGWGASGAGRRHILRLASFRISTPMPIDVSLHRQH